MCTDVIYSLTHIDSVTISSRNPKQYAIKDAHFKR